MSFMSKPQQKNSENHKNPFHETQRETPETSKTLQNQNRISSTPNERTNECL